MQQEFFCDFEGRIGHDIRTIEMRLFEKIDGSDTLHRRIISAIDQVCGQNVVAGRSEYLRHISSAAGRFPNRAVKAFYLQESFGTFRRSRVEMIWLLIFWSMTRSADHVFSQTHASSPQLSPIFNSAHIGTCIGMQFSMISHMRLASRSSTTLAPKES